MRRPLVKKTLSEKKCGFVDIIITLEAPFGKLIQYLKIARTL